MAAESDEEDEEMKAILEEEARLAAEEAAEVLLLFSLKRRMKVAHQNSLKLKWRMLKLWNCLTTKMMDSQLKNGTSFAPVNFQYHFSHS